MDNLTSSPQPQDFPREPAQALPAFPTGKRELLFFLACLFLGMGLCNSVLYGGFHLGFAVFAGAGLLGSVAYLLCSGCRLRPYSASLLTLSLLLIFGFARSDDGFVKFVSLCFLLISANLGLCLLAGQQRWPAGSVKSLSDAPRTLFQFGVGELPGSSRGLTQALRNSGPAGKKSGAVALGLALSLPVLGLLVWLLSRADAAFDGMIHLLPEWDVQELVATAFTGICACFVLYTRGVSLRHKPKETATRTSTPKGLSHLTVNTVLISIAAVYAVYLLSQLAYFSGGFLGILPEGYTAAEYARRGFFEMAWLCSMNLSIIIFAIGLVSCRQAPLRSTKLLCLFLGLMTLFLVATASAKMLLYIGLYGLTRLRLLTEVIMLFIGCVTIVLSLWLFRPRLPYMKCILLIALLMGLTVLWGDVDTVVAQYNVRAYQSGQLQTVDVDYLSGLGSGATVYLIELTACDDPAVAKKATACLEERRQESAADWRGWNLQESVSNALLNDFFG